MRDVGSMTPEELSAWMKELGEASFRGKQLFSWLTRGVRDAEEMTDLSKSLREALREKALLHRPRLLRRQESGRDGTVKFLWELHDDNCIETVLMRYRHGNSLCLSCQVGCRMGCAFCASALGGKLRDLTAGEMLDQLIFSQLDTGLSVGSIVLMGIGEPLDNYDETLRFLRLVNRPEGLNLGMRHISLSTCGLVPGIDRLAQENLQLTLSVSLHAPDDETREKLMPVNRAYGVEALFAACRRYFQKTGRRISYEYAMIDQLNDSMEQADLLAKRLRGSGSHVNLIPLNRVEESGLAPSRNTEAFRKRLLRQGIAVTVRRRLGGDIDASCGQLRKKELMKPAQPRDREGNDLPS